MPGTICCVSTPTLKARLQEDTGALGAVLGAPFFSLNPKLLEIRAEASTPRPRRPRAKAPGTPLRLTAAGSRREPPLAP